MNKKKWILFNKKLINLLNWKIDKILIRDSIVRKIEFYNYIKKSDVNRIIKYLNRKSFKYCEDKRKFNSIFNIILNENKKYISKNKYRKNNFDNINNNNIIIIKDNELDNYNYYYFVDFVKVLKHRNSNFLIKIYRNSSINKNFSKIEITYWIKKNNYNLYYWDWVNKLKGISEIINKISKNFDFIGFNEDFSWKINIKEKIIEIISWYNKDKRKKIINLLN